MKNYRNCFVLFILMAFAIALSAQKIAVDCPREVQVGESFSISFEVEGADLDALILPNLDAFQVVGGPMRSSQISIVNGATSKTASIGYQLLATKKGSFTIGSASMNVNGKQIVSRPITITVGGGVKIDPTITSDEDIFVRLELSPKSDKYYVGQQIIVKYVVYYNQDIQLNQIFDEPSFDHFFTQNINSRDNENSTTQMNGKMYNKAVVKMQALFPQKEGQQNLGSFKGRFGIATGEDSGGFFSMKKYRPVVVESNKLNLTVIPLPPNPPASFSGAVGKYTFVANVDKTTVKEKETLRLNVNIEGNGDSKLVNPPKFNFGPDLEVYDANKLNDNTNFDGQYQVHATSYEYFVIPGKAGSYDLTPEFSYFNPETGKYETITAPQSPVTVIAGTGPQDEPDNDKPETATGQPMISSSGLPSWIYGLMGAAVFGIIGYLIWLFLLKDKTSSKHPGGQIKLSKDKISKSKVSPANISYSFPKPGNAQFYQEMQNILFNKVSKSLRLNNTSPTIPYIVAAINEEKGADAASEFKSLFLKGEESIYGGKNNIPEQEEFLSKAQMLLEKYF